MKFVCSRCKRDVDTPGNFCPFCGTPAPQPGAEPEDPYIGRTIATKFFVNQRLGRGGMGSVYKATHLTLDRPVALKLLHRALLVDPSMVQRFHREARAASRLNHPNCINVMDFGEAEDGSLYIAMEYLAGRSLAKLLADEAPLGQRRVVRIVAQILSALAEAHGAGIVHRDLKLSNVMVDARRDEPDFVKVLDFGIAKLAEAGDGAGQLTGTGIVCGTPGYMSPEQARGEELDSRSDLYAVGVVLFELLTGRLPFEAETPMGLVAKHMSETPMAPRERRPDLGIAPDLDALVMRALAKDRAERFQTAEDMRDALLAADVPPDHERPPTPRPGPSSTVFIQAPRDPSPAPVRSPPPPGMARFGEPAPAAPRPAPPSPQPPRTPAPSPPTPGPKAPRSPAPGREATPAPARGPAHAPHAAGLHRIPAGFDEAQAEAPDDEAPLAPPVAGTGRPAGAAGHPRSAGAVPARRPGPNRNVLIGAGSAGLLLLTVLGYLIFGRDPFAPPKGAEPSSDMELVLAKPGAPEPRAEAPAPAAPEAAPAAPPPIEQPPLPLPDPPPVAAPAPRPPPPAPAAAPAPKPPPIARPPAKKGSGIMEAVEGAKVLRVPAAGTGQGILALTASPWAVVYVDGKEIGETPRELRVGEGFYRVRLEHPTLGKRETTITVPAGRRAAYNVNLAR